MHIQTRTRFRSVFAVALLTSPLAAHAQALKPQPVAAITPSAVNTAPTQLDMPLMSLEEGQRFQQQRVVGASDVPMQKILKQAVPSSAGNTPSLAGVSGAVINPSATKLTLGHALPTSRVTPLGFPRADFAIGLSKTTSQSVNAETPSSTTGLSNAVIK